MSALKPCQHSNHDILSNKFYLSEVAKLCLNSTNQPDTGIVVGFMIITGLLKIDGCKHNCDPERKVNYSLNAIRQSYKIFN